MLNAHVKMQALNAKAINDGNCLISLTFVVNGKEHLESIIKMLRKIDGVYLIERADS